MSPPINKKRLVEILASSCKKAKDFAIGVEHEHFPFYYNHYTPVGYFDNEHGEEDAKYGIKTILEDLETEADWRLLKEDGRPIAAEKEGDFITLEPGGQMELALKPMGSVGKMHRRLEECWRQIHRVAVERNVGFLNLGLTPWAQMPEVPKRRYDIMRKWMPKTGALGLDMMHRTASIQVSLDYSSEADMVKKFRLAMLLQPFIALWFANSPPWRGTPEYGRSYLSFRTRIWEQTDPSRCWFIPEIFQDNFGFESYAEFAAAVPMYFIIRNGKYIAAEGGNFNDFINGGAAAFKGRKPTEEDWREHLGTIFTQTRLKSYLEIRGCDGGRYDTAAQLAAFLVGLFYDSDALDAAYESLIRDINPNEDPQKLSRLTLEAARSGWKVRLNRKTRLDDCSERLVATAAAGLQRRAAALELEPDEEIRFLDKLEETVKEKLSPAERLRKKWETCGHDLSYLEQHSQVSFASIPS